MTLGRARRRTLIVDEGRPRNRSTKASHGFLTRDGIAPDEFLDIARNELERYPAIARMPGVVSDIERHGDRFRAILESGEAFEGKTILLATGVCDNLPDLPNLERFWGRSIFTCPYCDGWEFRDRRLGIYGKTTASIRLAQEMIRWSADIVICADDGHEPSKEEGRWLEASGLELKRTPVTDLVGDGDALNAIAFADGTSTPCSALFLSTVLRQSCDLPKKLSCEHDGEGSIVVDRCNRTSVPGCYAAGDAVTHRHQLILAAGSGVTAAMAINDDLIDREAADLIDRGAATFSKG